MFILNNNLLYRFQLNSDTQSGNSSYYLSNQHQTHTLKLKEQFSSMGGQIKLKETAIAVLLAELHTSQMVAMYVMASGSEMPESVSKSDLTEIIFVLCRKLDWIKEEKGSSGNINGKSSGNDKSICHVDSSTKPGWLQDPNHLKADSTFATDGSHQKETRNNHINSSETLQIQEVAKSGVVIVANSQEKLIQKDQLNIESVKHTQASDMETGSVIAEREYEMIDDDDHGQNDTNVILTNPDKKKDSEQTQVAAAADSGIGVMDSFEELIQNDKINIESMRHPYSSGEETGSVISDREDEMIEEMIGNDQSQNDTNAILTNPENENVSGYDEVTNVDTESEPFRCQQYNKSLAKGTAPISHDIVHEDEKLYNCHMCEKKYKGPDALSKHKKSHSKKEYLCRVCGKEFHSSHQLKRHEKTHTEDKPLVCTICDKRFKSHEGFKQHLRSHSEQLSCSLCDRKFTSENGLKYHLSSHSGLSEEKPLVCTFCDKRFKSKAGLKQHTRSHSEQVSCSLCDRKFTTEIGLKYHMSSHSGLKVVKREQ